MDKVKFFSINDMTCGYHLKNCERLLKEYGAGKEVNDINDIVELYNVKMFFDNKIYLKEWTSDDIKGYENIIKTCFGWVAKYFKAINNENLDRILNELETCYKGQFWELIDKFRVYISINEDFFKELLNTSKIELYEILKHKNIIEHFGSAIRQYMLNESRTAEILLDKYELKHVNEKNSLSFPKELSNLDKEKIINDYLDNKDANLNYIRLIANVQSNKDKIEVSPKTLLKARRRAEEQERLYFSNKSGIEMKTTVSFSESQNKVVDLNIQGQEWTAKYCKKWIENNNDYATLLNNFIYLFEFVDKQMRCTLVNKLNYMGVFERVICTSSQNSYTKGIVFDRFDTLSLLQIMGYYHELFSVGIRLEEVIEWFFNMYLDNEFDARNFRVTLPSVNSTALEKCTNIMPALESVLKQFSLFVEEGNIDFELLDIRSEHLIYKNIPSLLKKKYVYGTGEKFKTATSLLFSDQSMLGYSEKSKKDYENILELLRNEKLKFDDFPNYCHSSLNWLIEHEIICIDINEYIVIRNKLLIMILHDLYINEVVSYWKYPLEARRIIEELKKKNFIEFESSLFTRPEQDYINYYLNKSQFNNGLDLRNKYSHTQPFNDNNEGIHKRNYMKFLRIFILAVIKINDEFCIQEEIKKELVK